MIPALSIFLSGQAHGILEVEHSLVLTVVEHEASRTVHAGIVQFVMSDGSVRSAGVGGGPHVRVFSGADSTVLYELACSDAEISEGTVISTIRDDQTPDEETQFIISMRPIYVTSYQIGGSSGDLPPLDEMILNFQEAEVIHRRKLSTGEVQEARSGVNVCLGDGSVRFK